jgi:hypothetical protein
VDAAVAKEQHGFAIVFGSLSLCSSDPMKESAFPGWIIYDADKTRGPKPTGERKSFLFRVLVIFFVFYLFFKQSEEKKRRQTTSS